MPFFQENVKFLYFVLLENEFTPLNKLEIWQFEFSRQKIRIPKLTLFFAKIEHCDKITEKKGVT